MCIAIQNEQTKWEKNWEQKILAPFLFQNGNTVLFSLSRIHWKSLLPIVSSTTTALNRNNTLVFHEQMETT